MATNLVAGQIGTSFSTFLYNRSTNTVTLVSHADGSLTTTSNGASGIPVMSADGNSATGQITVANSAALDYETGPTVVLTVEVSDFTNVTSATMTIDLTNANEAPELTDQSFSLPENSAVGTVVGIVVGTDQDADSTLSYLIGGGSGRDLMIGGEGADRIIGNAGDDVLMAGWTAHDGNPAALHAIMAEWTSSRCYYQRVANLWGLPLAGSTRLNGTTFLRIDGPRQSVYDEGARDVLTGSGGIDWFFANLNRGVRDAIADRDWYEVALDLDFVERDH